MKTWHSTYFALIFTALPAHAGANPQHWPGESLTGTPCTAWNQGVFKPRDYYDPAVRHSAPNKPSVLYLVESVHFTPEVEQLRSGQTSSDPSWDIGYTLNMIPNHPRALWAMAQYSIYQNDNESFVAAKAGVISKNQRPPAECYLQRAQVLFPKDANVYIIYGVYLHKLGELHAALAKYQKAETLQPDNSELVYNLGLLLFDLGKLDEARHLADRAEALGYPLQGLKKKLHQEQRSGKNQ